MNISELVPIKDVARRLGVSIYTLYYWVAAGRIPHYKFGRVVRFSWPEIEAWLEKRRRGVG